jgi:hypothetical protein
MGNIGPYEMSVERIGSMVNSQLFGFGPKRNREIPVKSFLEGRRHDER